MLPTGQSKDIVRDVVKRYDNFFSFPLKGMTGADYRREWVQDRINELRGKRRMSYASIGRAMGGKSRQYIQGIAKGAPAGDEFISALCKTFGFEPPHLPGATPVLDKVTDPAPTFKAGSAEARTAAALERIQKGLEEQAVLLRTLAELLIARKG